MIRLKIGLIDVDGHNYPNLALMKISAWHKAHRDTVEWWWGFGHYDRVYMSKVFDETYMTSQTRQKKLSGFNGGVTTDLSSSHAQDLKIISAERR